MVTRASTASSHFRFHFLLFGLSTSALHLPRPGPSVGSTKGTTFTEAPSGPSHCSLGQKTRGQAGGGLSVMSQASSDCRASAAQGHRLWGALVHITDVASLYIYCDSFLAAGSKVS